MPISNFSRQLPTSSKPWVSLEFTWSYTLQCIPSRCLPTYVFVCILVCACMCAVVLSRHRRILFVCMYMRQLTRFAVEVEGSCPSASPWCSGYHICYLLFWSCRVYYNTRYYVSSHHLPQWIEWTLFFKMRVSLRLYLPTTYISKYHY